MRRPTRCGITSPRCPPNGAYQRFLQWSATGSAKVYRPLLRNGRSTFHQYSPLDDQPHMRLAIVVHVTGTLVRLFSPALLAPALVALGYGERRDAVGFVVAFAITGVLG